MNTTQLNVDPELENKEKISSTTTYLHMTMCTIAMH